MMRARPAGQKLNEEKRARKLLYVFRCMRIVSMGWHQRVIGGVVYIYALRLLLFASTETWPPSTS